MPYSLSFSSSEDSEEEDAQPSAVESSDVSGTSEEEDDKRPVASSRQEKTYGNREFWMWEFNDSDSEPLDIANLPKFSDNIAELQLMAALQYPGSLAPLPSPLAAVVDRLRMTKTLIFGASTTIHSHPFLETYDNYILCVLLAKQLNKINHGWAEEWDDVVVNFLYSYRVSLNGVLCGRIRGPEQITRYFIRWIHLRLGLYSALRVRNIKRKWFTRGYKVYRFTPIPHVTVLRIFLRDSMSNQRVMLHITREPNSLTLPE